MFKKFILNSGSNVVLFFFQMTVTFIMTPVLVRNLGNYDYGIWEIILALTGYMGLLDLGVQPTASRFAALHKAKSDQITLQEIYSTVLSFMALIGLLAMSGFFLSAIYAPHLLADEPGNTERYSMLLFIVGLQLLIAMPGKITDSYLSGYQKFSTKNNIMMVIISINNIIIYNFMTPSNAIILMAVVTTIGLFVKYVIYYLLLQNDSEVPVRYSLSSAKFAVFKNLMSFGFKIFVAGFALKINIMSSPIIIGLIAGVEKVIFFTIPYKIIEYARNFFRVLSQTSTPMFTQLHGEEKHKELESTFLILSKVFYAFIVLICVGLAIYGDTFLRLWLEDGYAEKGAEIILIAAIATMINSLCPLAGKFLVAIGKHGILAKVESARAIIGIPLSCVLVYYFGYKGAVYAVFIGAFYPLMVLVKCCKFLDLKISEYFRLIVLPCLLPTICLILILIWLENTFAITNYLFLLIFSVAGGLVYCTSYLFLSVKQQERTYLQKIVRQILSRKTDESAGY